MHELNNGHVPETVLNLCMFPAWNLFGRNSLLQQKRATRAVLLDENCACGQRVPVGGSSSSSLQVSLFSNTGIVFPFRLV
jgi:hypothetical protein